MVTIPVHAVLECVVCKSVMAFETYVISWNLTKRCNLRCSHCYLDAAYLNGDVVNEPSLLECKKLIDQMAEVNPNACLILTGGEPLLRDDIFEISSYADRKGFMVVMGTNGILLDDIIVPKILDAGIKGIGVSLDSMHSEVHDSLRGFSGSWEKTIKGIETVRKSDLDFQIQTTVTKENFKEIPALIDYAHKLGASGFYLFFLVCTGRGEEMTDITPEQYEEILSYVYKVHGNYDGMMVRAKCAPHFKRIAYQMDQNSPLLKGYIGGCRAGTNYCRISPEGEVTPCPYMPDSAGNINKMNFKEIWSNSTLFKQLRHPNYEGKCEYCEFKLLCGGCRARALAVNNNALGEDPWCSYEPVKGNTRVINIATAIQFGLKDISSNINSGEESKVIWTEAAEARLKKIPFFARGIAKLGLEKHAGENNLKLITPELMDELRSKYAASFGGRFSKK